MNRMFDNENNLKRIRLDMKIFKRSYDVFDKKHDRIYHLYDDMSEINVERISKTTMIDVISECNLNLMKILFDVLIWKVKKNVIFGGC